MNNSINLTAKVAGIRNTPQIFVLRKYYSNITKILRLME